MPLSFLVEVLVLVIGIMLVTKHYKHGWGKPETLSGLAFILLVLPSVLSALGLL